MTNGDPSALVPSVDELLMRIEGSDFARLQTRSLRGCVVLERGQGIANLNEAAGWLEPAGKVSP